MSNKSSEQSVEPVSPSPGTVVQLWERQAEEPSRAFAGFVVFRDLPVTNRNCQAVADVMYPSARWAIRVVGEWSKKYGWDIRVTAWDNFLDRLRRETQLSTIKTMAKRHVEQAVSLQEAGIKALKLINEEGNMSAADARLLITEGAKLERLARGLSTDKIDHRREAEDELPDLSGASEDELRQLTQLAESIVERAGKETSD